MQKTIDNGLNKNYIVLVRYRKPHPKGGRSHEEVDKKAAELRKLMHEVNRLLLELAFLALIIKTILSSIEMSIPFLHGEDKYERWVSRFNVGG